MNTSSLQNTYIFFVGLYVFSYPIPVLQRKFAIFIIWGID